MKKIEKNAGVINAVYNIAKPIAQELNLEIWDIQFVKEGPGWYLRIFIDNDTGITLEDCEKMSRAIDGPLELSDPIEQSYCLEICSPGIERELSNENHFQKFIGYNIIIRLIRPDSNGEKTIEGKLVSFDKNSIFVQSNQNEPTEINRKNISHVNLKALKENHDELGNF